MLRIKEIVKEKGMTVADLSEMTGILAPSLSRIVNGGNTTTETLEKIAKALEINVSELFETQRTDFILCPHCGKKICFH
jgi:transcriptional regulator with XRE-family HTH domain